MKNINNSYSYILVLVLSTSLYSVAGPDPNVSPDCDVCRQMQLGARFFNAKSVSSYGKVFRVLLVVFPV